MNLDRKMAGYAAGAAAAAAAGLVGAESADAAIVYTSGPLPLALEGTVPIDFDQNPATEADFTLGHERQTDTNANTDRVILKETDNGANQEAYVAANGLPAALTAGTVIGQTSNYEAGFNNNTTNKLIDEDPDDDGNLNPVGNFTADNVSGNPQYLGVRFRVGDAGDIRYGYIGYDITSADDKTGIVTGYAYEDTGAPIEAGAIPEPAGLALLAVGAAGLLPRRKTRI